MTTDPTMRIVWFDGRAFPVSSHPQGIGDPGAHWHVQTPDGEWHAVVARNSGAAEDATAWRAVMESVLQWLQLHRSDDTQSKSAGDE